MGISGGKPVGRPDGYGADTRNAARPRTVPRKGSGGASARGRREEGALAGRTPPAAPARSPARAPPASGLGGVEPTRLPAPAERTRQLSGCGDGRDCTGDPMPDYTDPAWWLACPPLGAAASELLTPRVAVAVNGARVALDLDVAAPTAAAQADVFWAHGTFTSPADHKAPNADVRGYITDKQRRHCCAQASAFNAAARVFAPHYRQATFFKGALKGAPGSVGAPERFAVAYADVEHAFDVYCARWGGDRPFFIAGHSQGAVHVLRLLRDRFSGGGAAAARLRARLVGAYAPGCSHAPAFLPPPSAIPLSARRGHVGSLAVWCCATERADLQRDTIVGSLMSADQPPPPVVNPLSWDCTTEGEVKGHLGSLGALPDGTPALYQNCVRGAAAAGGLLRVLPAPPIGEALLAWFRVGEDYHTSDVHLFWANVRQNALEQLAEWQIGTSLRERRGSPSPFVRYCASDKGMSAATLSTKLSQTLSGRPPPRKHQSPPGREIPSTTSTGEERDSRGSGEQPVTFQPADGVLIMEGLAQARGARRLLTPDPDAIERIARAQSIGGGTMLTES